MSLASDVNAVIKTAIEGIYSTLGFINSPGNVHGYLLDHEPERGTRRGEYLFADTNKGRIIRAWGVHTEIAQQEPRDTSDANLEQTLETIIEGYYGVYDSTNPTETLISHGVAIRDAIWALGLDLSNKVCRVESLTSESLDLQTLKANEDRDVWVLRLRLTSLKIKNIT